MCTKGTYAIYFAIYNANGLNSRDEGLLVLLDAGGDGEVDVSAKNYLLKNTTFPPKLYNCLGKTPLRPPALEHILLPKNITSKKSKKKKTRNDMIVNLQPRLWN